MINPESQAELAPCPFCGRKPDESERADNVTSTGKAFFIACMCGGYSANAHQFGETREEVVRKWNRRAAQSPVVAPIGYVGEVCLAWLDARPDDHMSAAISLTKNKEIATDIAVFAHAAPPSTPAVAVDAAQRAEQGLPAYEPKFDEAEFKAMVEKGTAAWKGVPDDWLERFRRNLPSAVPEGWKLAPIEPTPEIIAAAAVAVWPTALPRDLQMGRDAAKIVLMEMDLGPGATMESVGAGIATMAPAYRAMLAAAPLPPKEAV